MGTSKEAREENSLSLTTERPAMLSSAGAGLKVIHTNAEYTSSKWERAGVSGPN